ncbi:regulator of chromosome condensation 1/beta-lactamase-inhibitor protein II [Trametes polyzona]|nr:regulator of chromosome condensation 1/beta-lactamase-inhibitor protein II [Trametes polyzona]
MALATANANVSKSRTTTRTRGKRRASSPPPDPKPKKRAAPSKSKKEEPAVRRKPARNGPSGGVRLLNPLPAPPTHERPCWQLFGWGAGDSGQLGMGEEVLAITLAKPRRNHYVDNLIEEGAFGGAEAGLESIAAGALHSVLVDEKGTVWTCGMNDNAELGRTTITIVQGNTTVEVDEATSLPFHVPVPIKSLVDEGFRAVKVTVGDCIGMALDGQGQLRAWGTYRTSNGELGFSPTISKQYKPVGLPGLSKLQWSNVVAGDNHVLLLATNGEVYSAGSSEYMQLGRRVLKRHLAKGTLPERVILQSRSRRAVVIGAGADHSFAVDEDGTTWGWGLNGHGQTGTGVGSERNEDRVVPVPLPVVGLSKAELGGATVVQIAGGSQHTLFLLSDGRIFACGNYEDGQLGLPDDREALAERYPDGFVPEPVLVPFPDADDDPVVAVACGTHNNLAVTEGGAMYTWGRDTTGQLGAGEEGVDVRTPKNVVRKSGGSWRAKAVSCGGQHSLALLQKKT